MFILAEVRPFCPECASSMTMANFLSFAKSPLSATMYGNFSIVVTMIRLPSSMADLRSLACSAHANTLFTCMNCLMVSRICLSRMRLSVTTMTESNIASPPPSSISAS